VGRNWRTVLPKPKKKNEKPKEKILEKWIRKVGFMQNTVDIYEKGGVLALVLPKDNR